MTMEQGVAACPHYKPIVHGMKLLPRPLLASAGQQQKGMRLHDCSQRVLTQAPTRAHQSSWGSLGSAGLFTGCCETWQSHW